MPLGVDETIAPIFVVGCGRSGTTLLRLMLNRHSQLAIFGETQAFFWLGKYGKLSEEKSLSRLIRDWQMSCEVHSPYPQMMDSAALRKRLEAAASYAEAISKIMEEFLSLEKKARWGEKTPAHLHQIASISRAYPKAKFIHLIRDPRAVVSSAISELGDGVYNSFSVNRVARYWNRCEAAIERASAKFPGKVLKVKYEDLVEYPDKTLKLMCDFLGVAYEAEMLNTAESAKLNAPRHEGNGPVLTAHKGLLANINSSARDKWRERLDPALVGVVDHASEAWMGLRNYPQASLPREARPSLGMKIALYIDWQFSEAKRLIHRQALTTYWKLRVLYAG